MILELSKIEIRNFKGVKDLTVTFSQETHIYGMNATGKSSIMDALMWLLFNKNANGDAPDPDRFQVKPLDSEGNEIHNLDTSVTASFSLDGAPFVLRRVQRENWVTKRSEREAVFAGNISKYWINEVETKESDYSERIRKIATDNVFRLIMTLGAFNALKKEDRRSVLLSLVGIDVDGELLKQPEYSAIAAEAVKLGIGINDLKKVLQDRRTSINRELQLIPARIDEAHGLRPEITDQALAEAERELGEIEKALTERRKMQTDSGADDTDAVLKRIATLELELGCEKQAIDHAQLKQRAELNTALRRAELNHSDATKSLNAVSIMAARLTTQSGDIKRRLDELRTQYRVEFEARYTPPTEVQVCPTCGQVMDEQALDNMFIAARREFDSCKKKRLAEIKRQGTELAAQKQATDAEKANTDELLSQAGNALREAAEALKQAKAECDQFPSVPSYDTERIRSINQELAELQARLDVQPDEKALQLRSEIEQLEARAIKAKELLTSKDRIAEIDKRIAELEAQQTEYGQRRADTELMLYQVDQFIRARCGLLEDSINGLFPSIRWKLFNVQNNGGIKDCCECMIYSGDNSLVPYGTANTGAKWNADIEIISALSKHYNVIAPVFVDNAESINHIAKPVGQLITLSVSNDTSIRVENE